MATRKLSWDTISTGLMDVWWGSRPFDLQGIPTHHEVSALATLGLTDNIRPGNYAILNGAG